MKLRLLFTASIVLLSTHASFAGEPIFPQPFALAAGVGTEQSDFFLLRYTKGTKLVFSALVKELKATKKDQRAMFSQRIEAPGGETTFFAADKFTPLARLATYTVPSGTVFDSFLFNGNAENEQAAPGLPEEFFHVPAKGIYFSTGGNAPVLVRAETAAMPTQGFALQNPNFTANNADHSEAFRVVLGATNKKKVPEPFVSQGASRTTVTLHPTAAPSATISNPSSFTTFSDPARIGTLKHVVYFLAHDVSGGIFVYKTTVDTNQQPARYGAVQVTAASLIDPADLTGCTDGLLYTDSVNGVRRLFLSSDGTDSFAAVAGAGADPQNIAPNIVSSLNRIGSINLSGTGFTSLDDSGRRRFQVVSNVAGTSAVFTDSSGLFVNPIGIINTGDYFYYSAIETAFDHSTRFAIKDFNGGVDEENFIKDANNHYLVNPSEFTFIHEMDISGSDGTVYFTAQLLGDAATVPPTLYKIPANESTAVATQVLTVADQADKDNPNATATVPITSAHNLRNVSDSTIVRLYFCAPVTETENSQWRPMVKVGKVLQPISVGTKPWVLAEQ